MVLFWLYLTLLFTFLYSQNSYFSETTYCRHLKPFPLDLARPPNENFWDFSKNEMLWWQKMGKVVNQVKLTIPSQSQPHFGGKHRKYAKWPFWPNLSHFFGQICHCGSFSATLVWNNLKKLETSKNADYHPPEMKIFEISPKMRCFGGKNGKSCESGEIDHS